LRSSSGLTPDKELRVSQIFFRIEQGEMNNKIKRCIVKGEAFENQKAEQAK